MKKKEESKPAKAPAKARAAAPVAAPEAVPANCVALRDGTAACICAKCNRDRDNAA